MHNTNQPNLEKLMEYVDETELFEYIKPALATALNKNLPYLNIDASHLQLDPNSRDLFWGYGVDGKKYVYLYLHAIASKPQTPSTDIQIKANPFNIGFSFPFTILYMENNELTSSYGNYMKNHFQNCNYEASSQNYHQLLNQLKAQCSEDEAQ